MLDYSFDSHPYPPASSTRRITVSRRPYPHQAPQQLDCLWSGDLASLIELKGEGIRPDVSLYSDAAAEGRRGRHGTRKTRQDEWSEQRKHTPRPIALPARTPFTLFS